MEEKMNNKIEFVNSAGAGGMVFDNGELKNNLCSYCGGYTVDDQRGNCSACGAPKHEHKLSQGWNDGYFRLGF
jgi:ribosomal protein L37E